LATKTKTKEAPVLTAKTAYESVRLAAETIRNDEHAAVPGMGTADVLRQGDLYLIALDKPLPGKPYGSRQLAPGTTQGSRHIVEGDCDVLAVDEGEATKVLNRLVPATKGHRQFVGPMVVAKDAVTIAHPEHGDRTLPAGTYLVTYQRSYARDEIRRTMD
jgi:hypothetical protein